MRPPSDEDIENYDDIMWSFIDVLQALLDWRKIVDLQSNGETVFRVTLNFLGLLGPSQEPDIQVVCSWDELPPLPEKHPPGYWRQVWEASQAEQHQAAEEEAPPAPEEPGYWPVPPPNPAKRPPYPPPEDLFRLKPQPLASVPTIEDLLRTGDTVLQSMAAIGSGTLGPLIDWTAMAAAFNAMNQFFGMAPAKAESVQSTESEQGQQNAILPPQADNGWPLDDRSRGSSFDFGFSDFGHALYEAVGPAGMQVQQGIAGIERFLVNPATPRGLSEILGGVGLISTAAGGDIAAGIPTLEHDDFGTKSESRSNYMI